MATDFRRWPPPLLIVFILGLAGCAVDTPESEDATSDDLPGLEVVFCGVDEDCDDGNDCTAGVCGSDGVCTFTFAELGAECDDHNLCTEGDRCDKGGVCVGEQNLICNDDNPCTSDACDPIAGCVFPSKDNGTPCEDGSMCSLADSCLDGVCVAGDYVTCFDSKPNDCFAPACDGTSGECTKIEQLPGGHPCKDGNPCTDGDSCDSGGACQPGPPHECNPQDPCKKAWCNEAAKEGTNPCILEWKVEGVGCDDGDSCTDADKCLQAGDGSTLVCTGSVIDCNDNDPCTTDSCDTGEGCQFKPKTDGSPCADDLHWKCIEGDCICVPSCTGKECGPDGCGQTCGTCQAMADCVGGLCVCPHEECESECCEFGQVCSGGQCCTPNCAGKECGSDECSGTCGTCLGPQDVCQQGVCVCVPSCLGKECGGDGCGGSCGTCEDLAVCTGGQCVCPFESCGDGCCVFGDVCFGGQCCTPQCQGKECGSNGCGGVCGQCPGTQYQCQSGQCVCIPNCVGKECGSDGCTGSCGSCGSLEVCSNGICACQYQACGSNCCGSGQVCNGGSCCTPSCDGKQCGSNGCGGTCGSCSSYGIQYACQNGLCVCMPSCVGKECGTDLCGGSCGTCGAGEQCTDAGQCACQPQCVGKECGPDGCGGTCGSCSGAQYSCQNGSCVCTPSCVGKECGTDGCGGTCGTCAWNEECSWLGQCVCQPQCAGKECGPDGCGGTCGSCEGGATCQNGECVLLLWTDAETGLTWEDPPSYSTKTLGAASNYCSSLTLDGGGWHLPTIEELRSLIRGCAVTEADGACNISASNCLSDTCWNSLCNGCSANQGPAQGCYWPNEISGVCGTYWSSSPFTGVCWGCEAGWFVEFNMGRVVSYVTGSVTRHVRCVR